MYNGLTVCVVDDDERVRKLICTQLEGAGFTAVAVADAKDALGAVRQSNAALVIVDLFMPGTSGLTLIPEIRQANPDAKILAVSGSGEPYLTQARQAGAHATLSKPFRCADLIGNAKRLTTA